MPPLLELPSLALDALVGSYDFEALGLAVEITRRGSRLYARASGQSDFRLYATSSNTFSSLGFALSIRFEASGEGYDRMLVEQAGESFTGLRQ